MKISKLIITSILLVSSMLNLTAAKADEFYTRVRVLDSFNEKTILCASYTCINSISYLNNETNSLSYVVTYESPNLEISEHTNSTILRKPSLVKGFCRGSNLCFSAYSSGVTSVFVTYEQMRNPVPDPGDDPIGVSY